MEIWKEIKGYEGYYQISNLGNVRSLNRIVNGGNNQKTQRKKGKNMTLIRTDDGYLKVRLSKEGVRKEYSVHRLVALVFSGENYFEGAEVNHINCIRDDNRPENLEWVTHSENIIYSYKVGNRDNRGINNPRATYTEDEILFIRKLFDNGMTTMEIVKVMFPGLEYEDRKNKWSRINDICKRKTFKNIA